MSPWTGSSLLPVLVGGSGNHGKPGGAVVALLMVCPVAAVLPCPCVLVARATPGALWTSGRVREGRGGVCGCLGMLRKVKASSLDLVCLGQLRGCLLCCRYMRLPGVLATLPGGPDLQRVWRNLGILVPSCEVNIIAGVTLSRVSQNSPVFSPGRHCWHAVCASSPLGSQT